MFDELLNIFAPWKAVILLLVVLAWLLVPSITAWVFKTQRDRARAELALADFQRQQMEFKLKAANLKVKLHETRLAEFQSWVQTNPAPKDPEALRRWIIEAGRR